MKKLFTFVLALAASFAAYAQNWEAGEDVTAALGLGDTDGTFSGDWAPNDYAGGDVKTAGNYWKGDAPNEYRAIEDGHGVLAFYNRPNFDLYQVVRVPAGSYTIKVQSYYREGNPNDTFTNWNNKGRVKKNVYLYASILENEDPTSTVVRDFSKLISSMASQDPVATAERYSNAELSWATDGHQQKKYGVNEPIEVYYPSCNSGNYYYLAGPDACYPNEMKIVLSEDAYVRMGIRKIASIPEDYVPLYDFQVIYNGPANEEAVMDAAAEDCTKALEELKDFQTQLEEADFTGFAGAVGDLVMEFEDAIDEAESVADLDQILSDIKTTTENYLKSLTAVNSLDDLISMSADMLASTNFPGYSTFEAAYNQAVADAKTSETEKLGDNPGVYFNTVYETLATARANYLDSQEKDEEGAKDFSALIKYPWFVNPEYTPTQNEDKTWTLKESTWNWGDVQGQNDYSNKKNGRTDISSQVILGTDASVNNQWYKRLKAFGNGWSANSFHLYYQGGLIGVSQGWCSEFDDWEGVCQQLVGLPNGYYSLKGLARGTGTGKWNDDNLPPYHNIFAQNSDEVVVRSVVGHTDSYYSPAYGWNEWNPNVWQEHKTGTIEVSDGRLLIGCQSSWIANFTGFRLLFYGTNPPFTSLIQKELEAIENDRADITFKGDNAAIDELLKQIVLPIEDAETYDAALVKIHDINDYITKAKAAAKNYKAAETYTKLLDTYTTADEQDIINPAWTYAINLGENENDVYTMIDPANATANKYGDYLKLYEKAGKFASTDANLGKVISEQTAYLKANYVSEATLQSFIDNIYPAYNRALFAEEGAADATKDKPYTVGIVNPSFTDSPSDGWSGATPSQNQYGQEVVGNVVKGLNAELWNADPFTLSQKLVGLPAGTYRLSAQVLYRDGKEVTKELVDKYNAEGQENWENANAMLFAKTSDENIQSVKIKAIEALQSKTFSFTEGKFDLDKENSEYDDDDNLIDPVYKENYDEVKKDDKGKPAYPFDTEVVTEGGTFYYPASMYGFYCVCQKDPEFFRHSVEITIEDGETLEIGIQKTVKKDSDWVIFDNFELLYLSGETFKETVTEITETEAAPKAESKKLFNLAGQEVNKDFKGITIDSNGVKRYK